MQRRPTNLHVSSTEYRAKPRYKNSFETAVTFKCLENNLTNQNKIIEETKRDKNSGNSCNKSVQMICLSISCTRLLKINGKPIPVSGHGGP
jgi:hypothetical protein